MIRKRDLPPSGVSVRLSTGAYLVLPTYAVRCSVCGGQYSADPGDYWQWGADDVIPFECCEGAEFELGREVRQWVPVGADSAQSGEVGHE